MPRSFPITIERHRLLVEPVDVNFSIEQVYSKYCYSTPYGVVSNMSNEDARASIPNRDKHTLVDHAKFSHMVKYFPN
jgi:hypothetical protein